jgi:hypothetical protein
MGHMLLLSLPILHFTPNCMEDGSGSVLGMARDSMPSLSAQDVENI